MLHTREEDAHDDARECEFNCIFLLSFYSHQNHLTSDSTLFVDDEIGFWREALVPKSHRFDWHVMGTMFYGTWHDMDSREYDEHVHKSTFRSMSSDLRPTHRACIYEDI
jgi:hypothetical protein